MPIVDALAEVIPTDPGLGPEEVTVVIWSSFHGAVAFEVNHHLDRLTTRPRSTTPPSAGRPPASVAPEPGKTMRRRFERWTAKASPG